MKRARYFLWPQFKLFTCAHAVQESCQFPEAALFILLPALFLELREFYQSEKLDTELMLIRMLTIAMKFSFVLKVVSLSISSIS